ncbi:kinase-like domain-containing protein [Xylariaceae sp. FL1651]|nr:kinase-like domain-containing protein [Xylariaceae sp. FL1651]
MQEAFDTATPEFTRIRERSHSHDSLLGALDQNIDLVQPINSSQPPTRAGHESETTPTHSFLIPASLLERGPAYGLAWVQDGFSLRPEWTIQPSIEAITATLKAALDPNQDYKVHFLHEGTYSKLYEVSFMDQLFIMRVTLPVCPKRKTDSEVATLQWIYHHTSLPVPCVEAYDSSRNNPLGFEWILMTKIEGKPLADCWRSVDMGSKERLVKQIAAYAAAVFQQPFSKGIGSIYGVSLDSANHSPIVGEVRERQTVRRMLELIDRLEILMHRFLPGPGTDPSPYSTDAVADMTFATEDKQMSTILCHDNLSLDNILVDNDGTLRGVIDWQCISCLPLYEYCQFPAFLQQANDRFMEPVGHRYLLDEDGPPHPAYLQERDRYELSRLRRLYVEEMIYLAPDFVNIWRSERSANLRDYEAAVQNCDNEFGYETVEEWVKAIEDGRDPGHMPKRLHELLAG